MRVAVVGSPANETNVDLVRAWRRLGLHAELLSPAQAVARLGRGDVALVRLDVLRTLDGIEGGLLRLLRLDPGVRVVNEPRTVVAAHDKLWTARRLAAADVPHPGSELVRPGGRPQLALPLVLKPRFGSWGADIVRCESAEAVDEALAACSRRPWFRRHGVLAQSFVDADPTDLRVLVAEGFVVGGEHRRPAAGEWRTNISLGGEELPADPPPDARRLALAAAAALGGGLLGVDLLRTPQGWVVIELNAAVEFDAAYSLPGRDVFRDLAVALRLVRSHAPALAVAARA